MKKKKAANGSVIDLQSHPVWRAAHTDSREFAEAMRRHPSSYQRADIHS
jgi:hypothetical protein